METEDKIYEETTTFNDDLDKFDDDTTLDKEEDSCDPAGEDQVALKPKKTKRPQTQKQKDAFARCRKIRANKIAERKQETENLRVQTVQPKKKTKKKVVVEEPPPPSSSEEEEPEIVYRKKKPKKKPKKKRIIYQEPSSEESSDEEVVAVVKKRKKPKKKAKPPPKVIYEDELDSTDEETVNNDYVDVPYQPQLYIV